MDEEYPEAVGQRFDELIEDDRYVATVWNLRDRLDGLADDLFREYAANLSADLHYVAQVKGKLEDLGVAVETRGRAFADVASTVDLVVVDLYLGGSQDDLALSDSKRLLTEAIAPRMSDPPLVILMSRSEYLESKRDEFRDEVGLVDSGFRILRKSDIETGDRLELQLERLASNAVDTRRLARFFGEMSTGIAEAAVRTVSLMRKMRLSDVGQVRDLLLEVEGEPTGSYLVDVFDRVLQHEIEAQQGIIDAARGLNEFSVAAHPPPYVAGSPDLQELVARMLTQNPRRLLLPGTVEAIVAFGDLLCQGPEPAPETELGNLWKGREESDVLLVMTPACDLQRSGAPTILLLVGSLRPLTSSDWSYAPDARTPALRIGESLHWIRWNLKHLETASWQQLEEALQGNHATVVARLRKAHALELQQRVLSGLGRVGLVAPMPGTFGVEVEAYVPNEAGVPTRIDVPELRDGAVCFIGRDNSGNPNIKLVLTESGCDGLQAAVNAVDPEGTAEGSRKALAHIKSSGDLRRVLLSGLHLKKVGNNNWTPISSETGASQVPHMGLVSWNIQVSEEPLDAKNLGKSGVLLVIRDDQQAGSVSLAEVQRLGVLDPEASDVRD